MIIKGCILVLIVKSSLCFNIWRNWPDLGMLGWFSPLQNKYGSGLILHQFLGFKRQNVSWSCSVCYSKAFTGGLRKYLHYYRACVLSTPPTLSLLTIGFLFRKVGRQLRWGQLVFFCVTTSHPSLDWVLNQTLGAIFPSQVPVRTLLCRRASGCRSHHLPCGEHPFICERQHVTQGGCVSVGCVVSLPCVFPQGVKLLSYLYNEAQNNCSNENYPVLLSLLKTSCEPYTRSVTSKKCS